MRGGADASPSSSSLFAFKPRQVLLLEQQQHRNLAGSASMAKPKPEKPAQLKPEDESILIFSVALWLENKGFSKVLKRFLSAAEIQDDTWKARALNLNEIFSKYQETCNGAQEQVKLPKKQEEQVVGTKETNGDANRKASEETGSKNKKKLGKEDATGAETGQIFEFTAINEKMDGSKDQKSKASTESNGKEAFEPTVDQSTKKQKEKKKKKKSKLTSQSLDGDEKQTDVKPEATESKNQGLSSKSSSAEVLDGETTIDKKSKKKPVEAAENGVTESKKGSKKRKRMSPDEDENQASEEGAVKESKSKKSKGLKDGKDVLTQTGANEFVAKQIKEENSVAGQVDSQNLLTNQSDESNKGAINNNGVDKSSHQKSARKQRNSSAEPKTVNAFQRVKVDEVEFVDERLQDNSYWAKDGAEIGYGAKAQEVLGQVKGRDFRHEKTKKKRGSYRGGQIDLQSHSVKFNYSDEE